MTVVRTLATAILLSIVAMPAMGQQAKFLAQHDDWTAYTVDDGNRTICYMSSKPTRSRGKYTSRGEVLAFVSIFKPQPSGDAYYPGGQVSISAGYTYQKDSTVDAVIDGNKFTMFTQGDTAWAPSANDDKAMITAMKAGIRMEITGLSWRPTETVDTFSLKGFTAAYDAIAGACR